MVDQVCLSNNFMAFRVSKHDKRMQGPCDVDDMKRFKNIVISMQITLN